MNPSSLSDVKLMLLEQWVSLRRHKWIALATCWVVCVLGWTGVMMLPRHYESDARAYVDVNGLLTPLLKGLVVDPNTNQTTDYLRRTLLSRPNLEQAMHLAQMDVGKSAAERDALVEKLTDDVNVQSQSRNLFTISYTAANPQTAKNLVDALLTIFAEKAASSNRVEMDKARKFLDDQIASYEEQLRAAEQRRADFRKQFADYLADPASGTPKLQVLQQELQQARLGYRQAQVTRDTLQAELKQVPQFQKVSAAQAQGGGGGAAGPSATSLPVRLAVAKVTLQNLRLKYTDQHPDVIAAKNEVADLEAQTAQAAQAAQAAANSDTDTSSTDTPMVQIQNPTYEQIRLRLVDSETRLPAAKQVLDASTAEYDRVKALVAQVPDIDAKAKDVDRDYDVVKKNHDELVARRESASLSQAADDQADRTQFRIVDPPQVPVNPVSPNLPRMFSLVFILSLGVAVAFPIGLELVRATFSSSGRLRGLGLPVIGSVTFVKRPGMARRFVTGTVGAAVVGGALLVVYGALMLMGIGVYGVVL